jgi:hypothetical protein
MKAHALIGDRRRDRLQPRFQFGAAFRRVEGPAARLAQPDHVGQRPRLREHGVERPPPVLPDEIVGILAFGQQGEADRAPRFQPGKRQVRGPESRPLAGPIAVETENGIGRHAPQQAELRLRQGRAERRDSVLHAGLMERDHVHIALDDDDARLLAAGRLPRAPRPGEIVEDVALVEEFGVVGVEIFGRRIRRHRPPAEGDHLFPR